LVILDVVAEAPLPRA